MFCYLKYCYLNASTIFQIKNIKLKFYANSFAFLKTCIITTEINMTNTLLKKPTKQQIKKPNKDMYNKGLVTKNDEEESKLTGGNVQRKQ